MAATEMQLTGSRGEILVVLPYCGHRPATSIAMMTTLCKYVYLTPPPPPPPPEICVYLRNICCCLTILTDTFSLSLLTYIYSTPNSPVESSSTPTSTTSTSPSGTSAQTASSKASQPSESTHDSPTSPNTKTSTTASASWNSTTAKSPIFTLRA